MDRVTGSTESEMGRSAFSSLHASHLDLAHLERRQAEMIQNQFEKLRISSALKESRGSIALSVQLFVQYSSPEHYQVRWRATSCRGMADATSVSARPSIPVIRYPLSVKRAARLLRPSFWWAAAIA